MLCSIGPIAHHLAIVAQGCKGLIVGELDREGFSCRELEELASRRWDSITAAVVLKPPLRFGEIEERIDRSVGI
jgi:hypothetical protein